MRVGIFSESYKPLINGVSTSVDTLVAELERAGHTVFIFTSRYPRYSDTREGVYRFPSFNSIVEPDYVVPIPVSPRIHAAISKMRLDIVHSQSPFMLGVLASRIAKRYGLPLISTNHTLYSEYAHYFPILPPGMTRQMVERWMIRYYNRCDWVTAPSEHTRRVLVETLGIQTPVAVVPTGIPEPPYVLASVPAVKAGLGLPPDSRMLLYVGRLAREKNLDQLVAAFAILQQKEPKAYLVMAGSGNYAASLKARVEQLGLEKRVLFTGFLDRTRLDPLYKSADVFVFASRTDTQGLVIGEALSAGTPCVVVNAGGAPEYVTDGEDGYLVPDSAEAIASAALTLLRDEPLRVRMGEYGRRSSARMRPEIMARRIIDLYEQLLGTERGTAGDKKTSPSRS